jgi:hypothetical protein
MKFFNLVFAFALLVLCECCSSKIEVVEDRMLIYAPIEGTTEYFSNDTGITINNHLKNWASEVLFCLREPVLNTYAGEGDFIRLTWLRAFENPIVVRVNKFGDTCYIILKELEAKSDLRAKPMLLKDIIIDIKKEEWSEFQLSIDRSDFWRSINLDTSLAKDGATWFLECRINNQYKAIQRWDDGYLSSKDLMNFVAPLITYLENRIELKSKR